MKTAVLHRLCAILLAILVAAFASPASATKVIPTLYICPLGGEEFQGKFSVRAHSSSPEDDGGTIFEPLVVIPLEQCPNGFLLAKPDYSKDELVRLSRLIRNPAFVNLREHPTFEQLWWLRRAEGADSYELVELLYLASREKHYDLSSRKRQVRTYLEAVAQLPFSENRKDRWFRAYARAANLLREQEHFEDARKLLSIIIADGRSPTDSKALSGVQALSVLIDERNSARLPITFGPTDFSAFACLESDRPPSNSEQLHCATREVRKAMKLRCLDPEASDLSGRHPPACRQFGRYDDIIPPLAIALALIFLALTFRGLKRSERHS